MSDVALILGPVLFQDFEVPPRIGFGGQQSIAVHDLPGGARIVDTMGPKPADIEWSGIFSGQDATLRARMLDTLRVQAAVMTLSWDVFFYNVVIASFIAEYRNSAWVPYRLRCTVLPDYIGPGNNVADLLLSDVLGDGNAAASFAGLAGLSLSALQSSLAVSSAVSPDTAAYVAAQTELTVAQSGAQAGLSQANHTLADYPDGPSNTDDIWTITQGAQQAASLAAAGAYLGRAAANLNNVGQ